MCSLKVFKLLKTSFWLLKSVLSIKKKIWKYLKMILFVWILLKFVFSCYPGRYFSTSFGCRYCFLPWSTNIPWEGEWILNTHVMPKISGGIFFAVGIFLSAIDWISFLIDLLSTSVELESQNGLSKSLCLPACLSLCLPACLSVCLPVYIFSSSLWICEFWNEVLSLKNL